MSKILVLANHYNTLRIFRRELLKELVLKGNEVILSIPKTDENNIKVLEGYGCRVLITDFQRRGINPVKEFTLLMKHIKLIKLENPDKVITYTIKPNIYGSVASKICAKQHYVNVTGLGSAFQSQNITRKVVSFLYRISLNKANKIFFENIGNRDTLIKEKIIKIENTVVLPGAGVNLQEFSFTEYPNNNDIINFLFIGRIMKEKGVDELFIAIKRIALDFPNAKFHFIGWYEDDYQNKVQLLEKKKLISYQGFQPDVKPFIKDSHCVILPSYHEGMSNTLLEAASMGRPLITSNIHGCKEAVIHGRTGYLVNVKDSDDLYKKIRKFIELPYEDKVMMGQQSREYIREIFDKSKVVEKTIREMGL